MDQVVGISEMVISKNVTDVLVTYSLGSCLGLTLYDPVTKLGGMIHCLLPMSKLDPEQAKTTPAMFADTGLTQLMASMLKRGADKSRLVVKAAGCGAPMDRTDQFKIGSRNHAVMRKLMWKNNMLIQGEATGGTKPRTLKLEIATGQVTVTSPGETTIL